MDVTHKTWNQFWGSLLLVRCHENDPKRWSARRERAQRLFSCLGLGPGSRVLDLGCGDGILDVCLAELGADVIGVDRLAGVLAKARKDAHGRSVEFREADLRDLSMPEGSFDVVLFLEAVGLMGARDDRRLICKVRPWLRPGGCLVLDCPHEPKVRDGGTSKWERVLDDGVLRVCSRYDAETRTQYMEPTFQSADGEIIDLLDPYDRSRSSHVGVVRYLYPKKELANMLVEAGFAVEELAHHWGEGYYLIKAQVAGKPGDAPDAAGDAGGEMGSPRR